MNTKDERDPKLVASRIVNLIPDSIKGDEDVQYFINKAWYSAPELMWKIINDDGYKAFGKYHEYTWCKRMIEIIQNEDDGEANDHKHAEPDWMPKA